MTSFSYAAEAASKLSMPTLVLKDFLKAVLVTENTVILVSVFLR
jgi:hypothetical protein